MNSKLAEKTLTTELKCAGRIFNTIHDTVLLPNGNTAQREVAEHRGGVCIAALTEQNELLFVRQFRYPYKEVVLELPAGKLEDGDTPLQNGKRELLEETGAVGFGFMPLGAIYPSPGFCNEIVHLYFCRVKEFTAPVPDEDEFLEIEKIPLNKAAEMVLNNQIPDAKTQIAVLKTYFLMKEGNSTADECLE